MIITLILLTIFLPFVAGFLTHLYLWNKNKRYADNFDALLPFIGFGFAFTIMLFVDFIAVLIRIFK